MIKAEGLTKRYGDKTAVDGLTFTVEPGVVTGFLGPNGAGKSTTMRMILGLDRPAEGSVTVNGRAYADHPAPLHEVGALLEAKAIHTGRTAYNTCWHWPPRPASRAGGSMRSSTWWGCATSPASAPAGSPSAWASGSASPPPCSATPRR
jgi:energy-coupling factor transporter ATP-binding protein EcfA2